MIGRCDLFQGAAASFRSGPWKARLALSSTLTIMRPGRSRRLCRRSAGRSFRISDVVRDRTEPCSCQSSRRTAANVSEKVGRCLRYQAPVALMEWTPPDGIYVSVVHGSGVRAHQPC